MRKAIYIATVTIIAYISFACEDNIDKENPLIGKWRYISYIGHVETNDSAASAIIKKDIESINKNKQNILQYQFMTDGIFVLFDIDSDYKIVGVYHQDENTITFEEENKDYWAIKYAEKYFDVYIKDISQDYTPDSLLKLGVKDPENITIKKAWLTGQYKRI